MRLGIRAAFTQAKAEQAEKLHRKRVDKAMRGIHAGASHLTTVARTQGEMLALASYGWQVVESHKVSAYQLGTTWTTTLDRALVSMPLLDADVWVDPS